MFVANTYRIMLGSPSDIQEEIGIAKKIILDWSCLNAETYNVVLLPLHWQDNSYPGYGFHPQKILDRQLVDKSDMLVCIFGSKIGTATDTSDSGSIEEIEEHVKNGKPVMIFFKQNVDITLITPESLLKLQEFKSRIGTKALWCEYKDIIDFTENFKKALILFINEHWLIHRELISDKSSAKVSFSDDELKIFYRWANDLYDTPYSHNVYVGGRTEIHLAHEFGLVLSTKQEKAWWEDFIDRLRTLEYIKFDKYDSSMHPLYKITAKGYKFAETIDIKREEN